MKKDLTEKIDRVSWKPVLLNPNTDFKKQIKTLGGSADFNVVDRYEEQLKELFLLRNPVFRFSSNIEPNWRQFRQNHIGQKTLGQKGGWFYFPWLNTLIHFLPEDMHLELRTGRNRNLVTKEEQDQFYHSTVGFMGMSVGSHVVLTVVMTGGAKYIKLADPDTISGSNLNRIRTGFLNVGLPKTIAVARQISEINPYAKIWIFDKGIGDDNIEKFFLKPKIDLLVEETDSPYLKIKARFLAKKHKVPVIMAADNSDNTIVDVERYDLHKNLLILHGILGNLTPEALKNVLPKDLPKTMAKIAGANFSTVRMLESVMQVGKTLYSWPQLGTAATLCGATLAYLARNIILGKKVKEGRFDVNLDKIFLPPTNSELKKRDLILKKLQSK